MQKTIHIYTQYYNPISNACANRVEKYVLALKDNYDIKVITWMPNYPTWVKDKEYKWKLFKKEIWNYGEQIIRTYEFASKNEWSFLRLLNYISFMISSFFYGLFSKKPDTIIVTSPPLFTALSVLLLYKLRKIPYILEIRDLWPDSVVALWFMKKESLSYKVFSYLEKSLYKNAEKIIWVTKWICKEIENKWVTKDKIVLQYNVFDINNQLIYNEEEINKTIQKFNIDTSKKIFIYAWNHSKAQNLYNIIFLAQEYSNWNFYFVWEWESKKELEEYVNKHKINNIYFLWQQNKNDVYKLIYLSDYCIASLDNKNIFIDAIPTKILEYLAFDKKVIAFIKWDLADKIIKNNSWIVYDKYNKEIKKDIDNFNYSKDSWKNLINKYFSFTNFKSNIQNLISKNI